MTFRRTDIVLEISDDKVPTVGYPIAVPVNDGQDWWEMGDIIRTEVCGEGRVRLHIELAEGVQLRRAGPVNAAAAFEAQITPPIDRPIFPHAGADVVLTSPVEANPAGTPIEAPEPFLPYPRLDSALDRPPDSPDAGVGSAT